MEDIAKGITDPPLTLPVREGVVTIKKQRNPN